MSKQAIIAGVVVIILILGAGFFLMRSKSPKTENETASTSEKINSQAETTGSIKGLLGAGKNVTCKITYPDNSGSGTIYVSGKKFSGDFTMTVDGKTTQGNMLSDGEFMYSWTGTAGMKFKLDAVPSPSASASGQSQGADLDKQVSMNCSNWNVDNSKFTPPADVKFTDFSQMMQTQTQTQGGSTPAGGSQSACSQITDPQAKAACLKAVSGY